MASVIANAQHRHGHEHESPPTADDPRIAAFLAAARVGTAVYHDRSVAIADGFRRLGPDFPGMGEHWIHPGRMVEGVLDPARPQGLSYASIDGRPALIGVMYARPLRSGEPPPDFPVPGLAWHDHVGAIDDESALLHHTPTTADGNVRLTALHAWIWLENPDGLFTADNWALPFARAGLQPPDRVSEAAGRALSLIHGGLEYHLLLVGARARPETAQETSAAEILGNARARVEEWLEDLGGRTPGAENLAVLEGVWLTAWAGVGSATPPPPPPRAVAAPGSAP